MSSVREKFEQICRDHRADPEKYLEWMMRGFIESYWVMSEAEKANCFRVFLQIYGGKNG